MTIWAVPSDPDTKWVQTIYSTGDKPHAHTDYTEATGSPTDPAPIHGSTSDQGNESILFDSPSFGDATGGSMSFVSTGVQTDSNGNFTVGGSFTWGFTVKKGVTKITTKPRKSTPTEQYGSLQLIRREYPGFKIIP